MPLIGHEDIVRELRGLAASPEPPHALLLAGPAGTGRTALALEYAKLLNCERAAPPPAGAALFDMPPETPADLPCGVCRSCRLIDEGAHPDVIALGPGDTLCRPRDGDSHGKHPDSRDIRICQVRGLIDLVSRYPFEARYRMIIIDPADRLAREASNTILKTLEEPPGHSVFALISAAPEAIIETVISRCRRIDVRAVPRPVIEAGLVARGIDPTLAARAAEASHGHPGQALTFAASPDLMGDRARLLERCAKVAAARTTERFTYANDLAERFRRDRAQVGNELEIWEAFWEQRLREHSDDPDEAVSALGALRAVARAREDLQVNVMPRAALELMLLSFPRIRLTITSEEETTAHA